MLCLLVLAGLGALVWAPAASADLPTLLSACQAKDASTGGGPALPYTFCDDGVPEASGGATANPLAQSAVKVPSPMRA